MRKIPIAVAMAAFVLTSAATPVTADGMRRVTTRVTDDGMRRVVRVRAYYSPEITHNLITPYYVGYYGSHYSHYRPDPIPSGNYYGPYPRIYKDGCWRAFDPYVYYWVC